MQGVVFFYVVFLYSIPVVCHSHTSLLFETRHDRGQWLTFLASITLHEEERDRAVADSKQNMRNCKVLCKTG